MQKRRVRKPRTAGKILTYAEFKSVLNASELEIPEQSLRKSYRGLNTLRKTENLSWNEVREKVHQLVNSLHIELFESGRKLRGATIPLTARDWERIG
jgi:hypothetical protein